MSFGLYIHIPFCRSKCPYCSFSSVVPGEHSLHSVRRCSDKAGTADLMDSYTGAVSQELNMRLNGAFAREGGEPGTLYIGGGTPSTVPAAALRRMLEPVLPFHGQEFTVESNPESIDGRWLDGMLECGANRISIGVQSLDDAVLATLGRIHNAECAVRAVSLARKAGFGAVSIDLMFGIPGQTMAGWMDTLKRALDLSPDHISCYSLSFEEDTEFFERLRKQEMAVPDTGSPCWRTIPPGMTADMYTRMAEMLEEHGLFRYEISNFARPGYECRHNMAYWDGRPYLGAGASAHSFDGTVRSWNVNEPEEYIAFCKAGILPLSGSEKLDPETRLLEKIMLSLRTSTGLCLDHLGENGNVLTRRAVALTQRGGMVERYIEAGFLERTGNSLRLTLKGAVVSDELIADLAAEIC